MQATAPRIALDGESVSEFEHAGERYLARVVPIAIGEKHWVVQVVAPERDWTEHADAQARQLMLLAAIAVGVALGGGIAVARWIARPLGQLAEQARRIRQGDLDVSLVPRSRDEIGVLTRAMNDMVRALRDRNFVREALGRYVSPDLAERCLRDRDALRLGGELRQVAMLMSDLRGFSALSERLGAEAMIDLINRYLGRMTPIILAHGGQVLLSSAALARVRGCVRVGAPIRTGVKGVSEPIVVQSLVAVLGGPEMAPETPQRSVSPGEAAVHLEELVAS